MHSSRPSDTATLIARCTLLAARDPVRKKLVPTNAEVPLFAWLAAGDSWFGFVLKRRWTHAIFRALECFAVPGIVPHYLARKRWIEAMTRQSIERGVTQVVVVGAGFDTLVWRLHRDQHSVHFFEIDHPATQSPKERNTDPAANLTFLPVDLAVDSPATLLRGCPAFSADKPTLFIVEGLLMYFPEERVETLLHELTAPTRRPAEILFTFMEQAPDGSISFRHEHAAVRWWLRWRREPFQWGISRAALPAFLQRCGLRFGELADHDTLRTQILAPLGLAQLTLARGECLCHCSAP